MNVNISRWKFTFVAVNLFECTDLRKVELPRTFNSWTDFHSWNMGLLSVTLLLCKMEEVHVIESVIIISRVTLFVDKMNMISKLTLLAVLLPLTVSWYFSNATRTCKQLANLTEMTRLIARTHFGLHYLDIVLGCWWRYDLMPNADHVWYRGCTVNAEIMWNRVEQAGP